MSGVRSFEYTFSAGESKDFGGGLFFNLAAATNPVDIELIGITGESYGTMQDIPAGFWMDLPLNEDTGRALIGKIKVTSASAQNVTLIVGFGRFGSNKTSTQIEGGTLTPVSIGSTAYYRNSSSAALNTIVAPASNTNGIKITSVGLKSNGTGINVMVKESAPTSYSDGRSVIYQDRAGSSANYNALSTAIVAMPILVPAGVGLYEQCQSSGTPSAVFLSYEVL